MNTRLLMSRATDLRDAVGADNVPPLPMNQQHEIVVNWMMNVQVWSGAYPPATRHPPPCLRPAHQRTPAVPSGRWSSPAPRGSTLALITLDCDSPGVRRPPLCFVLLGGASLPSFRNPTTVEAHPSPGPSMVGALLFSSSSLPHPALLLASTRTHTQWPHVESHRVAGLRRGSTESARLAATRRARLSDRHIERPSS